MLTVAGDEYTATIGEQVLKVRLRLDPSRTPKAVDMTYRDDATSTRRSWRSKAGGRDADDLPGDAGRRATAVEFAVPAGSNQVLIALKRSKP